jgi:hypothetical protein
MSGTVVQSAATSNVFASNARVNAFLRVICTSPAGAAGEL